MNRSEEIPHLRSYFRQCGADDAKKLELVLRLRDIAIEQLGSVKEKEPRPMSDLDRKLYQAKGIRTEWDFTDYDDAASFSLLVSTGRIGAALSPSQKSAALLLGACVEALKKKALPPHVQDWILDAYAGLDATAVNTGKRFIAGRKPNSGGPIRKIISRFLKKNPAMKNPELWAAVIAKPPRGWTAYDARKFLEGPGIKTMTQRRFFNICSEERKKNKL